MGNIVNKVLLCVGGGRRRKWRPAAAQGPDTASRRRRQERTTVPVFTKTVNECCAMSPTPPLPVTEDTPPDMLAGSMDLQVELPSGKSVKMSVERGTPMMDLLVQITTANKIAPGSHVLQALGEHGVLPYKPSTPIGTLDTWTIQVIPKSRLGSASSKKAPLKPSNQQPFEQTFRLQVHLPRNQLYVARTSAKIALSDILCQVCAEKNLDPAKYELRHPGNLDEVLDLGCTLADYKLQEVVLIGKSSRPLSASLSSTDIMVLHREEEKRRQQAKSGSSSSTSSRFFGVFKRNRSSAGEGSVSSDSLGGRSVSPARSDESISRSASPPAPALPPTMALPPARPQRKRRPAPAPPSGNNRLEQQQQDTQAQQGSSNKDEGKGEKGTLISHSRNSSDSSGYHEASVLSESPDSHTGPQTYDSSAVDSLPRRSKLSPATTIADHSHALSRSLSSLATSAHDPCHSAKPSVLSASTTALSSSGQVPRKKRAAPPPPKHTTAKSVPDVVAEDKLRTASLDRHLQDKDTAVLDKSASLPAKVKLSKQEGSVSSFDSTSKASLRSTSSTEEEEIFEPEEEKDEQSNVQTPVPPPCAPSPQLAPVVDSPAASRQDPVEARLEPVVAIPTPKPRARASTMERHVPAPVPRPRRMSDAKPDKLAEVAVYELSGLEHTIPSRVENGPVPAEEHNISGVLEVDSSDYEQSDVFVKDGSLLGANDAASTSSTHENSDLEDFLINGKPPLSKMKSDTDVVEQLLRSSLRRGSKRGKPRNRTSDGSIASLRSLDDVPHFLNDVANIGRWGSVEALDVMDEAEEANRQSAWVLGAGDSDVEVESMEGGNMGKESSCETFVEPVPDVQIPRSSEQVRSEVVISQVEERQPASSMALPDPVVLPSPEDTREEPLDIDWEYQLPAPPSAFRDCASPSIVEGETVPLEDARVFQGTEGSVDSGDFSLTDVVEHPRPTKLLDNFSVHISGGEITRINPLYDPNTFEISPEVVTQSSFAKHESTVDKADHNWTSESKEEKLSRKLSEAVDRKVFIEGKPRSYSVGIVDSFQPHQLSNFKISTYGGRKDIDSIFREAEAESSAVNMWEFKEPLPVSKHARRYGSANSLEAAGIIRANSLSRDEVDAKLNPAVKRSMSHVLLGGSARPSIEKQQLETCRTPSLGSLAGELPTTSLRLQDVQRSSSTSQDKLAENLHQGDCDVPKDDLVHKPVPQKIVAEREEEIPLQSLQVLRTILPRMTQAKAAEEVSTYSSTNQSSETSGASRCSEEMVPDSKLLSSGSENREPAAQEAVEKRYRYQGPPAVKLSSWSERPKVKVDIKQDSDYRIGKETSKKPKSEDVEPQQKEVSSDKAVVDLGVVEPSKMDQTPLTMRLISNAPTRKGLSTSQILESISRPELPLEFVPPTKEPARTSVHVGKTYADPSRIPIVRAVELKKPFQQQLKSGNGVSISIVRQDEEVLVGGERVDSQTKDVGFAGVNSLARMFSAGSLKPFKNTRPLSAYEYGSGEKLADNNNIYIDSSRKQDDQSNNLFRSSSITNLSTQSIPVKSNEGSVPKKYTSVVGINKPGSSVPFASGSSVVKVNGFSSSRQLAPVVKGFRLPSQPASSVSVRIEHQTPTETSGLHARVQRSESAFVKSSSLSSRDQPPAIVKVHEKPVAWKSFVAKTVSLPGSEATPPPPPPPFLADVVLKKVEKSQPKNSAVPVGDTRGQLMEAIRNHGGRDTLKKTQRTEGNMPNVILRI